MVELCGAAAAKGRVMTAVVLVGEAYGEAEDRLKAPFVGASGVELLRQLNEAKLIALSAADRGHLDQYYRFAEPRATAAVWDAHPEVHRTNVFNLRPQGNDIKHFCGLKLLGIQGYSALTQSKYVRREFQPELERLQAEVLDHNPNLIVCLGNTALWAFTGSPGITKRRGTTLQSTHLVSDFKLLPTYHPAAILRQYENRPTAIADLMKAAHESKFPEIRRPSRTFWTEPTLEDIRRFIEEHIRGRRGLLSVDIETSGRRVTSIAFAPDPEVALVIPFDDARRKGRSYWASRHDEVECWKLVKEICEDTRVAKLFQNGLYDITFLYRAYGIKVMNAAEDTMLLSHALHPEALKGLGYLGSIYSDEGAWKSMRPKVTRKRGN